MNHLMDKHKIICYPDKQYKQITANCDFENDKNVICIVPSRSDFELWQDVFLWASV